MSFAKGIAVLVVALAIIGGTARSEDLDVQRLKELVEAQQAEMNRLKSNMRDLEAKMVSEKNVEAPAGEMTSINKNGKITIGGTINTRYSYRNGKLDSSVEYQPATTTDDGINIPGSYINTDQYTRRASSNTGNLEIKDAKLVVQIDVNEYIDACLQLNLNQDNYGVAQKAYVRWKNLCNSGFGIKVGRDDIVFGEEGVGVLDTFISARHSDGLQPLGVTSDYIAQFPTFGVDNPQFGIIPPHNMWDLGSVDQITPYWTGLDDKLSIEVSFMQKVRPYEGIFDNNYEYQYPTNNDGRSRNYGLGTMSTRIRYTPIESLKLSASVVNFYDGGATTTPYQDYAVNISSYQASKNNTAISLAFDYRPAAFSKMRIWSQWIHGWNVTHVKDLDSDVINYGASFDFTNKLTFFAQGEYLSSRYSFEGADGEVRGWSAYAGLQYCLGNGLNLETGWRYENLKYYSFGNRFANAWANTLYAQIGLTF